MPYNREKQNEANRKWREKHRFQYNEFLRNYQRENYDDTEREKKRLYREKKNYYNYELESKIFRQILF
jgi:hypothetical protein